jgi:transposase
LVRGEDYAYGQPSLLNRKLRALELRAGQPRRGTGGEGVWKANAAVREAERELAAQAEAAYKRTVADWQRNQARREAAKGRAEKEGAGATPGRAS